MSDITCCRLCGRDTIGEYCRVCSVKGTTQLNDCLDRPAISFIQSFDLGDNYDVYDFDTEDERQVEHDRCSQALESKPPGAKNKVPLPWQFEE